jgi:hypothetical protein
LWRAGIDRCVVVVAVALANQNPVSIIIGLIGGDCGPCGVVAVVVPPVANLRRARIYRRVSVVTVSGGGCETVAVAVAFDE